ncbi:MAG: LuxR C-terminal-related transcriptional regulator [Acidimicrobiales bacterium]
MRPVGPLVSKITRPRPPGGLVARSRLVDRLGSSDAPVWWLAAPAGAGKTTLLLQALAKSPTDVAWLTVDPADDDPVRFWGHVAAALDPDTAEPLLDLLDPADLQPAIDAVLLAIEQRDRPLRLVLDDLHELSDPSTLEALGRLLLRPPPNLTVVVVTRTALRLPLARLRAAGAVVETTEDDLAFDVAEVAALFDGTLSATTVESLLERTGGWATALGLLAVSAGPARTTDDLLASLVGERTAIADYLAGEVLRALPSAVHDFLVQTSIVGADLAPALCDALTGRDDSLAVLRELTRTLRFTQQLDTASDDPGAATFRYHPVLRGVLLAEFATLPSDEQRRLHRAATAWFRAEGLPSGAVRHAMAAGDDAAALELIVEHAGPYARRGRLATVLDWLSRYGLDRCRTNPDLQPMAAWALLNARRYDELDAWLTIDDTTPDDVAAHLVTVATHLARHRGDLAESVRLGGRAVEIATPVVRSGAVDALSVALLLAGDGDDDLACQAIDLGRATLTEQSVISGLMVRAFLATEPGPAEPDLDAAAALAREALGRVDGAAAERFHQPHLAWLALGRVALAEGRVGDAAAAADRAIAIAAAGREPLIGVVAAGDAAIAAHAAGDQAAAAEHLRRADELLASLPTVAEPLEARVRAARAATRFARAVEGAAPVALSEREGAVLALLPHRLPRRELAAQLFVSENTVKTQLTSIRHKLGVPPGGDIVDHARELGLLPAG